MEKDLKKIRNDILREMYRKAEPSLDFDEVLKNENTFEDDWYKNHKLESDKQESILKKHFEEHNLNKRERLTLRSECILNLGPSTPEKE